MPAILKSYQLIFRKEVFWQFLITTLCQCQLKKTITRYFQRHFSMREKIAPTFWHVSICDCTDDSASWADWWQVTRLLARPASQVFYLHVTAPEQANLIERPATISRKKRNEKSSIRPQKCLTRNIRNIQNAFFHLGDFDAGPQTTWKRRSKN